MQEPLPDAPAFTPLGFGPVGRTLLAVCKLASVVGGLVFVAIVGMSIVSIVGRKLVSMPVPGDMELVQMGSAIGASAFFAYCHLNRGDVKVDFFTQSWSPRVVMMLDAIGSTLVGPMARSSPGAPL
jgi:TRAP-type mannitol/chloroaromatic compound transport system permease small subunit